MSGLGSPPRRAFAFLAQLSFIAALIALVAMLIGVYALGRADNLATSFPGATPGVAQSPEQSAFTDAFTLATAPLSLPWLVYASQAVSLFCIYFVGQMGVSLVAATASLVPNAYYHARLSWPKLFCLSLNASAGTITVETILTIARQLGVHIFARLPWFVSFAISFFLVSWYCASVNEITPSADV